jgi:hypothetical protein
MSKPEIVQNAEGRLQPYSSFRKPINWSCICPGQATGPDKPDLYRQTGASAMGIGFDWAVAMEISVQKSKHGTGTDMSRRGGVLSAPVHILGSLAATRLAQSFNSRRISVLRHGGCKIEQQLSLLPEALRTEPEDIFARAQRIRPVLTSNNFEHVSEVIQGLEQGNRIRPLSQATAEMTAGGVWQQSLFSSEWPYNPVKTFALKETKTAPYFLANSRARVAYPAGESTGLEHEQNVAAYHLSLGDVKEEIAKPLGNFMDLNLEYYMDATAIRHAAITKSLGLSVENIYTL